MRRNLNPPRRWCQSQVQVRRGRKSRVDIGVDDLDAGVAWAVEAGATVEAEQPQSGVRVMLDPDGHPFCLFEDDGG